MNLNKLNLEIKSRLASFSFFNWSLNFLLKKNRIVLLLLSLVFLSYYTYLWYSYLYDPNWSADEKQEYIESKKEESVVFDKNKFNKVISEIENRKSNFQKSVENVPDIFSLE